MESIVQGMTSFGDVKIGTNKNVNKNFHSNKACARNVTFHSKRYITLRAFHDKSLIWRENLKTCEYDLYTRVRV